ncbi:MAG: ABC transporter ATP-binding protein [Bacteroidetes bacterium]|nr:ABC transporter ATP-binding protein [Bacteroidota bacterium]
MDILHADGVGKRFGRSWIFRNVTISVESGDSLAITGRNGSGKSTLLKMLAGLLRPTSGSVSLALGDRQLDIDQHILNVGYAAPDLSFYKKMSAEENLQLVTRLRGDRPDDRRVQSLLEQVGLRGRGSDLVGGFSSGMQQRMRIAAAILHSPRVLILDEPFSNLDSEGALIVRSVIESQIEGGGILLLATNSAEEAALCRGSFAIPEG